MCSAWGNAVLPTLGFPIRESAGHWLFSASPRLIAAVHALHRLQVPRHPPCALPILTVFQKNRSLTAIRSVIPVRTARDGRCFVGMIVQFSRTAKGGAAPGLGARSFKTQQHELAYLS